MNQLSPMFIGFDTRIGEAELAGRLRALERTFARSFGSFAKPIYDAGRCSWTTTGKKPENLTLVANLKGQHHDR